MVDFLHAQDNRRWGSSVTRRQLDECRFDDLTVPSVGPIESSTSPWCLACRRAMSLARTGEWLSMVRQIGVDLHADGSVETPQMMVQMAEPIRVATFANLG